MRLRAGVVWSGAVLSGLWFRLDFEKDRQEHGNGIRSGGLSGINWLARAWNTLESTASVNYLPRSFGPWGLGSSQRE